jgi:threonine-phosphate decarboxylase
MHGGNVFEIAKKFNIKLNKIIDFSANINPLGIHPVIKRRIKKNIDAIVYYPDNSYFELKQTFSKFYNLNQKNILPGNGSVELIYLLSIAMKFRKALIIEPNFSEYQRALESTKCKIEKIIGKETNNFKVPVIEVMKKKNNAEIILLSNPNNPSGYFYEKDELIELLNFCKKRRCYLFIDEVFLDFVKKHENISLKNLIPTNEFLIILKSVTKFYSIPGLRLGLILADNKIIEKIKKIQIPWSINNFSAFFPGKILFDKNFISKTKDLINKEKFFLKKELLNIQQIKVFQSFSNYLLLKILTENSVEELQEFLIKKSILIRNCSNYTGLNNKFFRIAVKKRSDNRKLIKLLKIFFTEKW